MPQKEYTVKNNETGQEITFQWHAPTEPTEADIEEVFASAAPKSAYAPDTKKFMEARMPSNELPQVFGWIKRNPGMVGAAAAGLAAAPFTGGLSVPAMMAATGGAAAVGSAAGNVIGKTAQGQELNPSEIATEAVTEGVYGGLSAGLGPALKGLGKGAYHLAMKPRLSMSHTPEDVAKLVQTGLDEGINVSTAGFHKAGKLIGQEAAEVRKLIEGLNSLADPSQGFAKIDALKATWAKRGVLDEKLAALDDVAEQYRRRYADAMPVEEMHDLKQGIWHETQNNWDKSLNPAKIEAQKAFGSGLRSEIERVGHARGVHTIGDKNARIGRLGELQDVIAGRAGHEGMPGLRQGVEMVGGASPGYVMRAIATSSPALSTGARGLYQAGRGVEKLLGISPARSHVITDERRLLGPGAIPLGPGPNPSYARGVPAPRSPRPIIGELPPHEVIQGPGIPDRSLPDIDLLPAAPRRGAPPNSSRVFEMPSVPDDSFVQSIPDKWPARTLDSYGIPGPEGNATNPLTLDALDVPLSNADAMLTPDELWTKKLLLQKDPRLEFLPTEKWKQLLKAATEGKYRAPVEAQPNVRITKDKVIDLYKRYIEIGGKGGGQ